MNKLADKLLFTVDEAAALVELFTTFCAVQAVEGELDEKVALQTGRLFVDFAETILLCPEKIEKALEMREELNARISKSMN